MRSPHSTTRQSPFLSTTRERHALQPRPSTPKNKLIKKKKEIAVIFHYVLFHKTDVIVLISVLLKTRSPMQKRWQDIGEWNMQGIVRLSEKAMETHSSALAWKIPRMEEPSRLQSMGSLIWLKRLSSSSSSSSEPLNERDSVLRLQQEAERY